MTAHATQMQLECWIWDILRSSWIQSLNRSHKVLQNTPLHPLSQFEPSILALVLMEHTNLDPVHIVLVEYIDRRKDKNIDFER